MGRVDYSSTLAILLVLVVLIIVYRCIMGAAMNRLMHKYGYSGSWFSYGFFGGIIRYIVRRNKLANEAKEDFALSKYKTEVHNNPANMNVGDWQCTCGRTNASYVTTCVCGKNKNEVVK